MDLAQLIASITPEIYENLKRAIELGKWPDGKVLSKEQKEHSMQALIAYEELHFTEEQRTGYVPPKPQTAEKCDPPVDHADTDKPLKWK